MALGSGETTVLRMVSAYSVMANGGRSIEPSFIDRIQDRYGRTIATCSVQGEGIDAWMVLNGWALAYRRYSLDYVDEEEAAQDARAG